MKIITPDCEYKQDIERYKENLKYLPKGSRVLIKRSDPAGISEALIGNWELGLVSIPVEPYFTPKATMDFIQADCRPHAIVNCTDNDVIFEFLDGGELSPETDHAIFYTSGTTGNPKGVVQTREGMKTNALAVANLHNFSADSIHLTALPLYHCNAAAMSLFGNYFTNGTVVFLKKFTPESYFKYIDEYSVTTANLVPTMVADLVKSDLPFPSKLKYVLTAATALSQEICREFYEKYGPKLRQGYGLSEGVNFSFTMPLLSDHEFKHEMVNQYPPVGSLVQGEFRIKDGEVQLRGENIMRCYWNNEQATNNAFTDDGWFRTGDRGEIRGDYLVLTGRFKEIIIKGGDNYSPVMIEDEFRRAGITGDLAVVACKDDRLGEDIALVCSEYQAVSIKNRKLQPASVRYGKVNRTQTRKPQRTAMSKGLVSMAVADSGYVGSLEAAGRLAQRIIKLHATNPQQRYLLSVANKLAPYAGSGESYDSVKPYFNAIDRHLEDWWDGKLTKHIFSGLPWDSLMNEIPMGGFPKLAHQFCQENNLYSGKVMEIGAGVGNFSRYVPHNTDYIRTDIDTKFLQGKYKNEYQLNIDVPYSVYGLGGFDLIVGVNVMHCSRNKMIAIVNAYEELNGGGVLLLSEGQSPAEVWALDILFGFIDGWWNRGGFIHRHEWLEMFKKLSPTEMGYSVYREGKYDLGGLVWLRK
jgi:acyl-coenzyme A synthetase/AMP-(fatty) acid ligase